MLINTCTVTNNADADSRKMIRRASAKNPEAFIGVMGCYSQLKPGEVAAIDGVDAVFGTKEKFDINDIIDEYNKKNSAGVFVSGLEGDIPFHSSASDENESRTRVTLKIQDGCDYFCTYCAVPHARGASRSMDFTELEQKLLELNDKGKHEIILSGINLGEYKTATGERFIDAAGLIDRLDLNYRVRISSIEPNLISDELIELVSKSDNLCPHFHIPLQSGSDTILKLMKRRYNTGRFRDRIMKIKEIIPHCGIGIDVIAGFPGETDALFEETYKFLESLPFTYLHVFTYSDRDVTPASKFENKVPKTIKKERTKLLRQLSDRKTNEFYQSQIGLCDDSSTGKLQSRHKFFYRAGQKNYVKVEFPAEDKNQREPRRIKLIELLGDKVLGDE